MESAAPHDVFDPLVRLLESTPCGIDANAFDRSGWGAFPRLSVLAGEIAGTHAGALGETFNAKIGGQILGDPAFQLPEGVARRLCLSGQERAVLRLAAHAPEIDHEDTCHVHGDGSPTVLLDQRERQVDARRYAGRRPYPSIANVNRVRLHGDVRIA
jgi:hypothetical protein